jgi:hypothetical protein
MMNPVISIILLILQALFVKGIGVKSSQKIQIKVKRHKLVNSDGFATTGQMSIYLNDPISLITMSSIQYLLLRLVSFQNFSDIHVDRSWIEVCKRGRKPKDFFLLHLSFEKNKSALKCAKKKNLHCGLTFFFMQTSPPENSPTGI